jgi:hypothetical protein
LAFGYAAGTPLIRANRLATPVPTIFRSRYPLIMTSLKFYRTGPTSDRQKMSDRKETAAAIIAGLFLPGSNLGWPNPYQEAFRQEGMSPGTSLLPGFVVTCFVSASGTPPAESWRPVVGIVREKRTRAAGSRHHHRRNLCRTL